jgi:hypothetical protein
MRGGVRVRVQRGSTAACLASTSLAPFFLAFPYPLHLFDGWAFPVADGPIGHFHSKQASIHTPLGYTTGRVQMCSKQVSEKLLVFCIDGSILMRVP